jgi:hypothetical protein
MSISSNYCSVPGISWLDRMIGHSIRKYSIFTYNVQDVSGKPRTVNAKSHKSVIFHAHELIKRRLTKKFMLRNKVILTVGSFKHAPEVPEQRITTKNENRLKY